MCNKSIICGVLFASGAITFYKGNRKRNDSLPRNIYISTNRKRNDSLPRNIYISTNRKRNDSLPRNIYISTNMRTKFDIYVFHLNKGNNKITEHRAIFQRERQNSQVNKQTKSLSIRLQNHI
jgi:hypothetical protein